MIRDFSRKYPCKKKKHNGEWANYLNGGGSVQSQFCSCSQPVYEGRPLR